MSEKRIYDYPVYSELSVTPAVPPTGFWKIYPKGTGWYMLDSMGSETLLGGGGGGGHIIADEGVPMPAQTTLNFVGAGVTVTNGVGETIVTIPGGGASSLSAVLALGNTTGANNISIDSAQSIVSGNGGGQIDLDYGGDPSIVVLSTDNGGLTQSWLQLNGGAATTQSGIFWNDGALNNGFLALDDAGGAYMGMNASYFRLTPSGEAILTAPGYSIASTLLTPDATAILDVTSTTKGALLPRMTTAQRNAIVAPAVGLIVYNTSTNLFNFYDGVSWTAIASGVTQTLSATLALGNTTGANNISINAGQAIAYNEGVGGFLVSNTTTAVAKYWYLPDAEGTIGLLDGNQTYTVANWEGVISKYKLKRTGRPAGNYNIQSTDVYIGATGVTPGGDTYTLPLLASVPVGQTFIIADESGTVDPSGPLTIAAQIGQTIDGVPSVDMTAPYGSVKMLNTGAMWKIID